MLRPTAIQVQVKPDFMLEITFDNMEKRIFDVKPYIKGNWYGELSDPDYFKSVRTDGFTVVWENGQDICPDELYEKSEVVSLRKTS